MPPCIHWRRKNCTSQTTVNRTESFRYNVRQSPSWQTFGLCLKTSFVVIITWASSPKLTLNGSRIYLPRPTNREQQRCSSPWCWEWLSTMYLRVYVVSNYPGLPTHPSMSLGMVLIVNLGNLWACLWGNTTLNVSSAVSWPGVPDWIKREKQLSNNIHPCLLPDGHRVTSCLMFLPRHDGLYPQTMRQTLLPKFYS